MKSTISFSAPPNNIKHTQMKHSVMDAAYYLVVDEAECAVFTQVAQVYWDGCYTDDDWCAWYEWQEEEYEDYEADHQDDYDIDGTDMLLYGGGRAKGKESDDDASTKRKR